MMKVFEKEILLQQSRKNEWVENEAVGGGDLNIRHLRIQTEVEAGRSDPQADTMQGHSSGGSCSRNSLAGICRCAQCN